MLHKSFQVVLVILLVVFTAAGLVLFVSPLTSLLLPTRGGTDSSGIVAISGGMSNRILNLLIIVVVLLAIAGVYLISRRRKLP